MVGDVEQPDADHPLGRGLLGGMPLEDLARGRRIALPRALRLEVCTPAALDREDARLGARVVVRRSSGSRPCAGRRGRGRAMVLVVLLVRQDRLELGQLGVRRLVALDRLDDVAGLHLALAEVEVELPAVERRRVLGQGGELRPESPESRRLEVRVLGVGALGDLGQDRDEAGRVGGARGRYRRRRGRRRGAIAGRDEAQGGEGPCRQSPVAGDSHLCGDPDRTTAPPRARQARDGSPDWPSGRSRCRRSRSRPSPRRTRGRTGPGRSR